MQLLFDKRAYLFLYLQLDWLSNRVSVLTLQFNSRLRIIFYNLIQNRVELRKI